MINRLTLGVLAAPFAAEFAAEIRCCADPLVSALRRRSADLLPRRGSVAAAPEELESAFAAITRARADAHRGVRNATPRDRS